jgi:hypothetical protein
MTQAVADEGGRHRAIVDEAPVREAIQARTDSGGTKALLAKPSLQLGAGARSIRDQVERRVTDAYVRVRVQQGVALGRGKVVAHSEATAFQRFERDLERIVSIEMEEHAEAARSERLDAGDEGAGHACESNHGSVQIRSGVGSNR